MPRGRRSVRGEEERAVHPTVRTCLPRQRGEEGRLARAGRPQDGHGGAGLHDAAARLQHANARRLHRQAQSVKGEREPLVGRHRRAVDGRRVAGVARRLAALPVRRTLLGQGGNGRNGRRGGTAGHATAHRLAALATLPTTTRRSRHHVRPSASGCLALLAALLAALRGKRTLHSFVQRGQARVVVEAKARGRLPHVLRRFARHPTVLRKGRWWWWLSPWWWRCVRPWWRCCRLRRRSWRQRQLGRFATWHSWARLRCRAWWLARWWRQSTCQRLRAIVVRSCRGAKVVGGTCRAVGRRCHGVGGGVVEELGGVRVRRVDARLHLHLKFLDARRRLAFLGTTPTAVATHNHDKQDEQKGRQHADERRGRAGRLAGTQRERRALFGPLGASHRHPAVAKGKRTRSERFTSERRGDGRGGLGVAGRPANANTTAWAEEGQRGIGADKGTVGEHGGLVTVRPADGDFDQLSGGRVGASGSVAKRLGQRSHGTSLRAHRTDRTLDATRYAVR
mmetsp:Transcript_4949/g.15999  ORF Transcript_4949/g.15999 Transcript_4949/m.15999 type:complete len:508 (-) Transcript_4949:606-2129(-)